MKRSKRKKPKEFLWNYSIEFKEKNWKLSRYGILKSNKEKNNDDFIGSFHALRKEFSCMIFTGTQTQFNSIRMPKALTNLISSLRLIHFLVFISEVLVSFPEMWIVWRQKILLPLIGMNTEETIYSREKSFVYHSNFIWTWSVRQRKQNIQ